MADSASIQKYGVGYCLVLEAVRFFLVFDLMIPNYCTHAGNRSVSYFSVHGFMLIRKDSLRRTKRGCPEMTSSKIFSLKKSRDLL